MYINGVYNLLKADSLSFFFLIWKELNTFSSLPKGKQQCAQKERQVICQLLQHVHHLVDMLCILKGGDLSCYCIFSAHVIKCQSWRSFPHMWSCKAHPETCSSPVPALAKSWRGGSISATQDFLCLCCFSVQGSKQDLACTPS